MIFKVFFFLFCLTFVWQRLDFAAQMSVLPIPGGEWRLKSPTVKDAMGGLVASLTQNPDVTKVSLPSCFIYPYSLCELAAFRALRFQHELMEIEKLKSPLDRILQVTRWFMTSMEQMESMSKKPFNPVLGETLSCWVIDPSAGPTLLKVEQVCHHPPVTAICMRNEQRNIQFSSNVVFGITFHGNSVSCKLQGRADVELGNLKETYTAPNWVPDVIIQNVLFGTRRQLWSGNWSLSCQATGLGVKISVTEVNANAGWLSALKSGMYENLVSGFVYKLSDPSETPLKVISGHAGRKIYVADAKSDEKELLVDCDALKMEEIHFEPEAERSETNSLVIWKKSIAALLVDDLQTADKEKTLVEMTQREIRKQREEKGEKFVPKFFQLDEASNKYVPLPNALKDINVK